MFVCSKWIIKSQSVILVNSLIPYLEILIIDTLPYNLKSVYLVPNLI